MGIFFHVDTVEIYEELSDTERCGVDQYGKPRKCTKLKDIVQGDLQSTSPNESRHAFGTKTSNSHKLYLDSDLKVENTNILKVRGYRGVFKVVGDPQVFDKLIPHQIVSLQHIPHEKMVII
jgi:hypothetical protein